MKWVALLAAGVFGLLSTPASAQPENPRPARFGVAGRLSTLGIGLDFGVPVTRRADLRAAVNLYSYSHTFQSAGFDLDSSLKMQSFVVQLDWHVFKGSFHVS